MTSKRLSSLRPRSLSTQVSQEEKRPINDIGPNGETYLTHALRCNRTDDVRKYLKNGANTNICNSDGELPLMIAVQNNNLEAVKLLLQNNANVDGHFSNGCGKTPLIMAVEKQYLSIATALLEHKATVDACYMEQGPTPLCSASGEGNLSFVTLLLHKGANINYQDDEGCTPLMYAAINGHVPVIKRLLSKNAATCLVNKDGFTAEQLLQKNHPQLPELSELLQLFQDKHMAYLRDVKTTLFVAAEIDNPPEQKIENKSANEKMAPSDNMIYRFFSPPKNDGDPGQYFEPYLVNEVCRFL